jgi:hypothetical protein
LKSIDWRADFQDAWARLTQDPAGPADITIVGIPPDGRAPIHDRWWITDGSALDFGTSVNSLGFGQESEIQERDNVSATLLEKTVDQYMNRTVRWVDAGKIQYATFSL